MRLVAHPALHLLFESLAYLVGFAIHRHLRKSRGDLLDEQQRCQVFAAASVGALIGSRGLGLLEQSPLPQFHWGWQLLLASGGKTIVGGLLGGWLAVEIVKALSGIRQQALAYSR